MLRYSLFLAILSIALAGCATPSSPPQQNNEALQKGIYNPGVLAPLDSQTHLKVGMNAPDFTLPALSGKKVRLSSYRGEKNVVLSFVPAAWTPVCSDQWPGYNLVYRTIFQNNNAVLLGITVDNIPSLHSWTGAMGGVVFPVLSDFHPHGGVARKYGVLRSSGVSERALFVIDRKGILRHIDVHDINKRPPLDDLITVLENLK